MQTLQAAEILEKKAVGFGNGAIVYVPKRWAGKTVLVAAQEPPQAFEREALKILEPFLGSVQGLYLFGSRARGEARADSDADFLVLTDKPFNPGKHAGFEFLVLSPAQIEQEMAGARGVFLRQALDEAKPGLNARLLEELRRAAGTPDYHALLDDTLAAFKQVKELLDADRRRGVKEVRGGACVYSLVLRAKALYAARCQLRKKSFTLQGLRQDLYGQGLARETVERLLEAHRAERDERRGKPSIRLVELNALFEAVKAAFLETEAMLG
ncbi:MAG TPA: nucleotidyltransferase domain-containing protein [Candidatus Diapherotrites archaeon]|uniref:Nucleotidyltransferase domain-containing protein n=1 Tax=Candidatus Iainarchaeum sp. TaxID=3101447 RepID=A0A7J4JFH6_9ARCH|nr:nucleotidyltransferase domain-containing protein [Candidatus Diapherotrites archaeon]HIH16054.1 nucleotidyltransferase domain-containing protein [Candidatus Diapherotrites archaeon]